MKVNTAKRYLNSRGASRQEAFGISEEDTAHIMGILRDTLYSDRIMAVLREYAANAWDANREAGRGDIPIKVHVPTFQDPTLRIRDDGPGLSMEDVYTIYTQYGKSTKRTSDDVVGVMGIGGKSAFAYSDTFTVISRHGGVKRVYVAVLDESNLGVMQCLHEEPCDPAETGIEIQVAVRQEDIYAFQQKAACLFRYFDPRPEINIPLDEKNPDAVLKNGQLYYRSHTRDYTHGWTVVMGCIPYRMDFLKIQGDRPGPLDNFPFLRKVSGVLCLDIGEADVSASREELKYTKKTEKALISRLENLADEYMEESLALLKDENSLPWTKRLRVRMLEKLGFPIPDAVSEWNAPVAHLSEALKSKPFILLRERAQTTQITVRKEARLVVGDDKRSIRGFDLRSSDYLVKPKRGASPDEVRRDLEDMLKEANLTGIEIVNLSALPFRKYKTAARRKNEKHRKRVFKLTGGGIQPLSANWEPESREPSKNDVFVILDRFHVKSPPGSYGNGTGDFYGEYRKDKILAFLAGIEMPEILGYKTTARKPLTYEDPPGTPYHAWRKKIIAAKIARKLKKELECVNLVYGMGFYPLVYGMGFYPWYPGNGGKRDAARKNTLEYLKKHLGPKHRITMMFSRYVKSVEKLKKMNEATIRALRDFDRRFPERSPLKTLKEDLEKRYPLLFKYATPNVLHVDKNNLRDEWMRDEWIRYVKLIDKEDES